MRAHANGHQQLDVRIGVIFTENEGAQNIYRNNSVGKDFSDVSHLFVFPFVTVYWVNYLFTCVCVCVYLFFSISFSIFLYFFLHLFPSLCVYVSVANI